MRKICVYKIILKQFQQLNGFNALTANIVYMKRVQCTKLGPIYVLGLRKHKIENVNEENWIFLC